MRLLAPSAQLSPAVGCGQIEHLQRTGDAVLKQRLPVAKRGRRSALWFLNL